MDDDLYLPFFSCSSYVGRIGGAQTISVGNADASIVCKHGNIVHEIAHSLGFFHEHSRPDRDDYVNILWDNIEGGEYTGTFSVTKVTVCQSLNGCLPLVT